MNWVSRGIREGLAWRGQRHGSGQAGGAGNAVGAGPGAGRAQHARKLAHDGHLAVGAAHVREDVVDVDAAVAEAALQLGGRQVVVARFLRADQS